ncbi:hypothetical protein NC981_03910 [Leptolyngbya sp. DQ-M1]|uniref:hypothetical protein n=1 Tax=Leptolyngbya sp. DQ-M1 TaxID=2933920 RepID=UPI00329A4591
MAQLLTRTTDQRIVLYGDWERFKLIQQGFDETPGAKLAYYQGMIEIFMPGEDHATFVHIIGYLITTFLIDQNIAFKPTGDKTLERERLRRKRISPTGLSVLSHFLI